MGDPKFSRRSYETPKHPWEQARMDEERKLLLKYGLKNKRELWKAQSQLRDIRRQARLLQARVRAKLPQAEKEAALLLERLARQGLLNAPSPTLDDVLALTVPDLLSRRLQWVSYVKGLAGSVKQSRQLIVHGHVGFGDHRVTRPGYLVRRDEELRLGYHETSPLTDEAHTLRSALREKAQAAETAPPEIPAAPAPEGGA